MYFIYTCQYFNPRTRRSRCDTSLIILPLSLVLFQSTHPKIRMRRQSLTIVTGPTDFNPRTRRSGCDCKQWSGKATSKFTAKTKCFEFTKASLNKTFTRISWCETPVTFMCNSGSHAFLRQQFSSKDHSKTALPLLYCPI